MVASQGCLAIVTQLSASDFGSSSDASSRLRVRRGDARARTKVAETVGTVGKDGKATWRTNESGEDDGRDQ